MKIKHQLSLATLVMAGVFVTGCSQQEASGGSQVSGGSQAQVEGGSQVSGSQQQVEAAAPVVAAPIAAEPAPYVAPAPAPAPMRKAPANRWFHYHPEAPACAKTKSHAHKYTNRNHRHHYACQKKQMAQPAQPQVDVYALQRKLKAKGYYKGPIDGIVGPGTRSALQRFMKR